MKLLSALFALATITLPAHAGITIRLDPFHGDVYDQEFYRYNYIYYTTNYTTQESYLSDCVLDNRFYSEEVPKDNLKFKGDKFSKDIFGNVERPAEYETRYYCK